MIHNVLSRQLPLDAGRVTAALATAGIDPDRRPQTLAVGEWLALREALGPIGPTDAAGVSASRPDDRVLDPLRRLSPVVRLAPAKLNLTLAVVGRRDGRLPHAPLGLRAADPGRPAQPRAARRRPRHAPRQRARRRTAGRQPRLPRARGRPGGGRRRLGGRTRAGAGPRRPPRQADPGRGRAGRRVVGRRGDPRRRARGVGRRARRARASRGRRPPRLGRPVLPGRRAGARRGARRTGRAAPRPARHARASLLVTPAVAVSTPDVFAAFDAIRTHGDGAVRMSSTHLAEELRAGLTADRPRRPGRACSRRPTTCCRPPRWSSRRSCRSSAR